MLTVLNHSITAVMSARLAIGKKDEMPYNGASSRQPNLGSLKVLNMTQYKTLVQVPKFDKITVTIWYQFYQFLFLTWLICKVQIAIQKEYVTCDMTVKSFAMMVCLDPDPIPLTTLGRNHNNTRWRKEPCKWWNKAPNVVVLHTLRDVRWISNPDTYRYSVRCYYEEVAEDNLVHPQILG